MALLLDTHPDGRSGTIAADMAEAEARVQRELGTRSEGVFDLEQSRQQMRTLARLAASGFEPPPMTVEDRSLTTPLGQVLLRTFSPESPGPVLVLVHGGGWIAGGLDTHDSISRWLASEAEATVVLPDYGAAPEHPFPHAVVEVAHVIAALGRELAPGRRLFVMGDSAGANIGAMALLRLSPADRARVSGFVSVYGPFSPTMDLSSHRLYGDGRFGLSVSQLRWCWTMYGPHLFPDRQGEMTPLGKDLSNFPSTLCVAAECDVLLDDTLSLYSQLAAAQVDVSLSLWPGMPHGCLHYVGAVQSVSNAARSIVRFIDAQRPTPRAVGGRAVNALPAPAYTGPRPVEQRAPVDDLEPLSASASGRPGSVAHRLAMQILRGELKPGQSLATEENASAAMGISRGAYREAMRTLGAKGLIVSLPKVGTKIAQRDQWNILDPDLLSWSFEAKPDDQFVKDLFELRNTVEPTAASMAADRRDENDLTRLSSALARMAGAPPVTMDWLKAIVDFHQAVLLASKNEALAALWPAIQLTIRWAGRLQMTDATLPVSHDPLADHARVFETIASQDPAGAQSAMNRLIEATFGDIANLSRARPAKS